MGYPLKTSNAEWLSKAIELYSKRISMSIVDDAFYNLNPDSDCLKGFKRYTMTVSNFFSVCLFYLLCGICFILLLVSLFIPHAKLFEITLSFAGLIICYSIPTYQLAKNRPPKIRKTDSGVEIDFSFEKIDFDH